MNITLSASGNFLLQTGERTQLEIPADLRGVRALYDILLARQMAPKPPKIGEPGYPTQHALDAWLAVENRRKVSEILDEFPEITFNL